MNPTSISPTAWVVIAALMQPMVVQARSGSELGQIMDALKGVGSRQESAPTVHVTLESSPIFESNPVVRPDGGVTCSTQARIAGFGTVSIVEARLKEAPRMRGLQRLMSGGIRGYWYLRFQIKLEDQRPYSFSYGQSGRDNKGRAWLWGRSPDEDYQRIIPGGTVGDAEAVYVSYDTDGADVTTIEPHLDISAHIPMIDEHHLDLGPSSSVQLTFPELPTHCSDIAPVITVASPVVAAVQEDLVAQR